MITKKSLSDSIWKEKIIDENIVKSLAQKKSISEIFSKLLISRNVNEDNFNNFIKPDIFSNIPNPFDLRDMNKDVDRYKDYLKKNQKIGIIADYDVDGLHLLNFI